jgi:hypothetical protein
VNRDPNICAVIHAFRQQRTVALALRFALWTGAVLGVATLLGALIDRSFFLSDNSRIAVGLAVYATSFLSFAIRHGRQILIKQDARTMARMIESTHPELDGELLSLIELDEDGALQPSTTDNPVRFTDLLHEKTRKALASLDHAKLFPMHMLRIDAQRFAWSGLLVIFACYFGGESFRSNCQRVLLPLANIERHSETVITLRAPNPLEGVVPADEEFSIAAEIRNHRDLPAFLEVRRSGNKLQRIPFSRAETNRFTVSLNSQTAPFSYRVQCNDAATRYYRFQPVARPTVQSFQKHYTPPAYTGLPEETVDSHDGHLKAITGTKISLHISVDQAFTRGRIVFTDTLGTQPLELHRDAKDPRKASAVLEITQSGHYEVELLAELTGFRSAMGQFYEIQADPDQPPDVSLDSPLKDLILPVSEKLSLVGQASDDFELAQVALETRRNSEQWMSLELSSNRQKNKQLGFVFDPLAQNFRVGDTWTARFAATDSKGQRTESNAVKITISHPPDSATDRSILEPLWEIEKQLAALQKQTVEAQQQLSKSANAAQSQKPDSSIKSQLSEIARRSLETAIQTSNEIREALRSALKNTTDIQQRADLLITARALNQSQFSALQPALQSLNRMDEQTGNAAQDLQTAKDLASLGDNIHRSAQQSFRASLASAFAAQLSDEAALLTQRRREIEEHKSAAAKLPNDANSTQDAEEDPIKRLDQLNRAEAADLGRAAGQLRDLSRTAAEKLGALSGKLQATETNSEKFQQALDATSAGLRDLKPRLQADAESARAQLQRTLTSNAWGIQKAKKEVDEIVRRRDLAPERQNSLTQSKVEALADLLRANAQLESDRPDGPAALAESLHQASRALDSASEQITAKQSSAVDVSMSLDRLSSALRTIEGAALIEEAHQAAERTAREAVDGRNPKRLSELTRTLEKSLTSLPKNLDQSGLPAASVAKSREAATQAPNARLAGELLSEALKGSEEVVSRAKAEIESLAPSLSSEMKVLAAKSQAAASISMELSKQAPDRDSIQKAAANEQRLDSKIENLREALRMRANAQDILTEEGRQQARDADAASALLKSPERAAQTLQTAAKRLSESARLLPKAADIQNQTAKNLAQLARHFENLEKGDAEATAQSRDSMRQTEQVTGAKSELDERQAKAEALSEMAKNSQDATADAKPKTPDTEAADSTPDPQATGQQETKRGSQQSKAAVRAAIDAQKQADRTARAEHSNLSGTPASASEMQNTPQSEAELPAVAISGDQNWGRLPKRIATDLMQGRRETISGEYQPAIEAYFRAIAEKSQQQIKPSR